ncbi:MAG TPA: ammonium transporter [Methylovirgula sp.]|jgi:Amt family ammonium transporter|nr:ammonium transporter [Methylovirgula sp.]
MIDAGDTAWLLISSVLVLLMTLPALGLFYAGLVQAKNILSILIQCIALTALMSLLWFAFAYSEAFSGAGALIGQFDQSLLLHMTRAAVHPGTKIPESVFVMFQMTFAVITPALMIGAYAERIRFGAVMLFSALWLVIVYAPVTHWIWGGGWLDKLGVMDFAGGIVVHVTAGVSALVIAAMLGPREGFPRSIRPPHAPWMVMVGASLLWVGWFGFNAGSALVSGGDAGMTMLATHLSAATATLTWICIERIGFGKPSLVGAVTGTIAGLAAITPASGYIGPLGAIVLGFLAALICYSAVLVVKRRMKVDDALDVLGVHGIGGVLGTVLMPFLTFVGAGGVVLSRPVPAQFMVQLLGVVSVGVWSAVATFVIIKVTALVVGLRVDREHEIQGLDFISHGETGYNFD